MELKEKKDAVFSVAQIGHGRLGKSLYTYLKSFKNINVQLERDLKKIAPKTKYIFLAVPDSEIPKLIESIDTKAVKVIHFSGKYYSQKAIGIHPVNSFSKEGSYNWENFDFVVDTALDNFLASVFVKTHHIDSAKKLAYHSYLSTVANSFQLFSYMIGKEFEKATHVDKKLLKKLVLQSLESEKDLGEKSFSGPWVRGEMGQQQGFVELSNDVLLKKINELFIENIKRYKNENS